MKKYYFIDESGDPLFYGHRKKLVVGTEGFQPYLIIGMIETNNRKAIRNAVVEFMDKIKADVMWAIQRKLQKGESRYFNALKNKYGDLIDLYGK